MNIQFADLKRRFDKYQPEFEEAALRALRSGWYVLGNELKTFEGDFAAWCGAKHCVGVGNGMDALRLALEAYGIGPGDEVLVQANTYIATALAVTENGATPVFVDADGYFGIDAAAAEAAITPRTKAVMVVHLYGQVCDMEPVMALAKKHGLRVIEDCAQSHGARYRGKLAGSFGEAGCFSFYPTKPVGAFGDAGAVVTNSDELAEKLRMLRNYGSKVKYIHELPGVNSRMDELQAALTGVALRHAQEGNALRQAMAKRYLEGIVNPKVTLPAQRPDCEHVWHVFPLLCGDRDGLHEHLERSGIYSQIHYPVACHLAPCYAGLGYRPGQLPRAEYYAAHELSLPIYVGLEDSEIQRIIDAVNAF